MLKPICDSRISLRTSRRDRDKIPIILSAASSHCKLQPFRSSFGPSRCALATAM